MQTAPVVAQRICQANDTHWDGQNSVCINGRCVRAMQIATEGVFKTLVLIHFISYLKVKQVT